MRRTRRDGPLDIVFVLFNADGMGGTARSGIAQANALLSLGEGHRVRILSVTRSGAHTHYPLTDGLEVTYLVDVRGERPTAVSGQPPTELAHELAQRESTLVPRSWDALFNGLTDATLRDAPRQRRRRRPRDDDTRAARRRRPAAPADVALVHQEHRASSSRVNDMGALLEFAPRADIVGLADRVDVALAAPVGSAEPRPSSS